MMNVSRAVRQVRWLAGLVVAIGMGAASAQAQETGSITGRVVAGASLRPLIGAQVSIPGTGLGTLTNQNGQFILLNVPAGERTIRAQMIGYGSQEQIATIASGGASTMEFVLAEEVLALDEVVVTGQVGQARRREVGNAITQINLAEVVEPIQTVESLFQGRAPGVRVSFTDASIGSGAAIRLRGNVSASQSNQPLIYVDGIRQPADAYRRGGNTTQASPLADINPNDIERVEVIKGAAAATLYGSQAAAGVIQIFTKKGSDGSPRFTYQTDQSVSWVRPWASDFRPRLFMDPWLQNGYGQTHQLSVSGGAPRIRYYVSGNYLDREGVQVDDFENRYTLRSNVTVSATERFTVDVNSMFSNHYFETLPAGNALESLFFNVYRTPNNFVGGALPTEPEFYDQINSLRVRSNETTNQRANLGMTGTWSPIESTTARFTAGYDRMGQEQVTFLPFGHPTAPDGEIESASWFNQALTLDASASHRLAVSDGFRITTSIGGQLVKREEYLLQGEGEGLPGPGRHTLSSAASQEVTETGELVNTGGLFAQQTYDLADKYFLTIGARLDGSSAFGEDFGLEFYPKISGSYVISDEPFWPESFGSMKLRAAYGFAGRAPGAFDAVRTWEATSYRGQTAFTPDNVGNPNLGPERTGELEVGFDGAFLNDRVVLDFTYYNQKTTEALFNVTQVPSLGFDSNQLENVGSIKNTGIEVAADFTAIRTRDFTWSIGTDITTNHSEVLSTGGVIDYNLVEGYPAPVIRGAKILNPDEFADPIYEFDAIFGPSEPTHIIGLNTSFELPRGFVVSARGEYVGGHWAREFSSNLMAQRTGYGAMGCDHVYEIVPHDRSYLGPGDDHPNLGQLRAKDRALCYARSRSDAWMLPRDFAKLREITVQAPMPFTIPGTTSGYITGSVRNLFRWVNDEFYSHDPESTGARNQISSLSGGSITDLVPAPATATLSVQVNF